ncbi:hypothetical protein [Paenibacillus pini]|uniref:Uncharacterized protein n=1 Tax=Paenibacillus pini JCM 16418 TaxID=1236976 RepID=W7YGS8_9BACL|nr:hypothetical protein [Paenibacillus pini]GAF06803.1 hypothetical protein JCM16418_785 [Paenibacillus pini JCM 16418]
MNVKAKTYWVWTDKAEAKNPARTRSGEQVWIQHLYEAPQWLLDEGLIQDAEEVDKEGQMSIFDYIEGVI